MATSPITGTTPAAQAASQKSLTGFGEDFQSFLKMLTTQLKNQDPLEPLDSNEFTAQLVQFASVEQSIKQNSNLEKLIGLQNSSQTASLLNYIGKTIDAQNDLVNMVGGSATMGYTLPTAAHKVTISILDATGNLVRTENLTGASETASGAHPFIWDGRNDQGIQQPDGTYRLIVTAEDPAGEAVDATTSTSGKVTGLETTENGQTILLLGNIAVPLEQVTAVRETTEETPGSQQ